MPFLSYTTMLLLAGTPRKEISMLNWILTGLARVVLIQLQMHQHR